MMKDANKILKKQIAGGSWNMSKVTLILPTSVVMFQICFAILQKVVYGVSLNLGKVENFKTVVLKNKPLWLLVLN